MKHAWLMFVAGAVLTWGAYVVTIDHGRAYMAGLKLAGRPLVPPAVAAMRAFLFIGLAYCVLGVFVPLIYMAVNKVDPAQFPQDPRFIGKGVTLSFIAGLLGAAGALCIVFAVGAARRANVSPGAVAALVFCFAPIVNVIISLVIEPPATRPNALFFLGIILAAAGAGMVLYYKPAPAPHTPAHAPAAAKPAGDSANTTAQAAPDAARAVDGAGTST